MSNEIATGPWAGFEVIHTYTRAQAIADGVLVDVSAQARECGFVTHTVMTATLFADCERWAKETARSGNEYTADRFVRRVLCFACEMIRAAPRGRDTDRIELPLSRFSGIPTTALVHIGPGDDAEPVVTLMYPGEE